MFWQTFITVFLSVFIAELGDKTQLATMLFSTENEAPRLAVFAGSALALTVAAGLAVLAGSVIMRYVNPGALKLVAGLGFIAVGIWTIFSRGA
jgi:putative Ca2+/H+ antiporter (TMEM165/GDT1 family)